MRGINVFKIVFLLPIFCSAQNIEGIGFLKVGKTTVPVIDSLKSNGYSYKESSDFMDKYRRRSKSIFKTINAKDKLDYNASVIPEHQKYDIDVLEISGIELKDITVDFLNDTLYSISISNPTSEFKEAIELKYGKPYIKADKKTITCTSRIAGRFDLEETTYTSSYRDDELKAYSVLSVYYDSKCEKQYLSYFTLYNEKNATIVSRKETLARKEFEEAKTKEKKKTLTDF